MPPSINLGVDAVLAVPVESSASMAVACIKYKSHPATLCPDAGDWTTKASTQQDLASAAEAVRATLRTAAGGVIEGLEEAELPGEQPIIM